MSFKGFLIWSSGGLVFAGAELFMQLWQRALLETFMFNNFKFGLVVQEEMSFKEIR